VVLHEIATEISRNLQDLLAYANELRHANLLSKESLSIFVNPMSGVVLSEPD
jgi:hypothetical protein